MNSLKKGEGVPLLNFDRSPGIPLLNFEGGPGVPLLNFDGCPGSRVPRSWVPGSWSHFYNMPNFQWVLNGNIRKKRVQIEFSMAFISISLILRKICSKTCKNVLQFFYSHFYHRNKKEFTKKAP